MPIILKYLITAGLVVLISEVARRSDKLGALIAALPMVTVLAMTWMFFELKGEQQTEKIANHAWYTFWYVIPTMPMFLLMPLMLRKGAVCAYRLDHEALRCRAYVSLIQHRECCCYGTIVTGVPTLTFE
jgi:hypothetical protein